MFPIHINDGQNELPTDDIFYVVAKEGIYIRKKLGIMDSLVPVKKISTLQDIQTTARMNVKKIPGGQFAKVIAFFKEVYKEHRAEAIVLLFYNEETKVYKIVPPVQKVNAASIEYDRGLTLDGWTMAGSIHSHAAMSAFHSGVDHDDETSFDGLHLTIGNAGDDQVSISASIVSNGHRFMVDPEDYVSRLVKTKDEDEKQTRPNRVVWKWNPAQQKMVQDEVATSRFGVTTYRRMDKRYSVAVSKKYFKVPNGWMGMVEKKTYSYHTWQGYGHGVYGGNVQNHYNRNQRIIDSWRNDSFMTGDECGWGHNFDSSLWGRRNKAFQSGQAPKLLEAPKTSAEVTPDEDEIIPCTTCKFKEFKLLLEENDVEETYYQCKKCDSVWEESSLIDGEKCPICITDEFLLQYEDTELNNEYIPADEHDHLFVKDDPIEVKSDFIRCGRCAESFHLFPGEDKCPFCYTMLNIRSTSVQEEDIENQMKADSGVFLGENTEEIYTAATEEISQAAPAVEHIPDPAQKTVPLPESTSQAFSKVRSIIDRFMKRE